MVSGTHRLTIPALRDILMHRKACQAQSLYTAHLTWLIGAQLFTLAGGRDYPVPDVLTVFPQPSAPRDHRTAQDIRQAILTQLTRKEESHG